MRLAVTFLALLCLTGCKERLGEPSVRQAPATAAQTTCTETLPACAEGFEEVTLCTLPECITHEACGAFRHCEPPKQAPPPNLSPDPGELSQACESADDCVLAKRYFGGDSRCCIDCNDLAVNASWYEEFDAYCADKMGAHCPKLNCRQPQRHAVVCNDGECGIGDPLPPEGGPSPIVYECSTDADCALTHLQLTGDEACCRGCGEQAVQRAFLGEFAAWCSGQEPACRPRRCSPPSLGVARCQAGRCEVAQGLPAGVIID